MKFGNLVSRTHDAVFRCFIRALLPKTHQQRLDFSDHASINKEFSFLKSVRNAKTNTFITKRNLKAGYNALFVGGSTDVGPDPTRISLIVSSFLKDAKETKSQARRKGAPAGAFTIRFRSPYSAVVQILTDPDALETQEISRFFVKIELMEKHNTNIDLSGKTSGAIENEITFAELDQFYTTLEKYIQGRDPRKPPDDKQLYLAELFSAHGFLSKRVEIDSGEFFKKRELANRDFSHLGVKLSKIAEYRRSENLVSLPSIAELANVVFGVPIAISGFNNLLNGGLRQGAGEGTVTLLRGGAGSGKTTLSISIQRAVEALGIPTIFVSSEESLPALVERRESVLNLAQKSHSCYVFESAPHEMLATEAGESLSANGEPGIFELVRALAEKLEIKQPGKSKVGQFSRLFLVIDGIHNYISGEAKKELRKLISICRKTNTHVLITSSDEWAHSEGIEYFVDNYFSLHSRVKQEPMPYVQRGISILKTRHQSSLIGDHFMRFQDEGDLLFTPNFSELLKSHSRTEIYGPDREVFSKPFALVPNKSSNLESSRRLLALEHYDSSVTLLYGRGSSSKTSLSLRFLATPNTKGASHKKRILVVSFLSPDSYYQHKKRTFLTRLGDELREKIAKKGKIRAQEVKGEQLEAEFPNWKDVDVETLSFTPGMITAEEVYSSVASKIENIDAGDLRYSGVLFDGLHNVFVQFPLLENHPELWSALVNLVRRVGIKTVITFTDFEVWGARTLTTVDYENKRAKPLLVALSQSIDYGFGLIPLSQVGDDLGNKFQGELFPREDPGLFVLSSFLAHSQAAPADYLIWDRTTETIRLSP